ncbi:hypothetical protein [Massilia brevitalea]|uniref:hypothetical protein n=1 Tax=Massilia brevitalea TaxID=442526 RepID=UPI002739A531|nr:hypothetical protein [Massilia brevitalea]
MKDALKEADIRGKNVMQWFKNMTPASSYAAAEKAWDALSEKRQAQFTAETGLKKEAYIDMVRMITKPPKNSKGTSLLGDAKQGLVTESIMTDAGVSSFLMGIFKDFDQFTLMTHALMKKNLKAATKYQSNASEEYLAAMVARAHNGGKWQRTYQELVANDEHDYVKNFLGIGKFTGKGDFKSLRCTEDFGTGTIKPGNKGNGIGGLEMTPIHLH